MTPRRRAYARVGLWFGGALIAFAFGLLHAGLSSQVWSCVISGVGGAVAGWCVGTLVCPLRPTGMRMHSDDRVTDLDGRLIWEGRHDGLAHWVCPLLIDEAEALVRGEAWINVDMMPARSTIDYRITHLNDES